jgi:hypothetical protein
MMRRRIVWRVVWMRHPGCEFGTSFAAGRQPDGGDLLAVADGHPSPWLHEGRDAFGKDFPLTEEIAAGKFAHSQKKLNTTACTGDIAQRPAIVTMDRF